MTVSNIEKQLIDLLCEVMEGAADRETITPQTALVGSGLSIDSILLLRFLNKIEAYFNIEVDEDDITAELFANVNTLANYIETHR